jgi:pimeloyl-ACP methyl ester carboxylesterase
MRVMSVWTSKFRGQWCRYRLKRRSPFLTAAIVIALVMSFGVAVSGAAALGRARSATGAPIQRASFSRLVDIGGGRTMFMECRGRGSPTVVLVAGLGERADNWSATTDPSDGRQAVYPRVAKFTRVCAYDRPGTATMETSGWQLTTSTPVPQPTTVKALAGDLNALLTASGEPGPYVLVGHSLGGAIVRLYAGAYPAKVAGLVLDDALSEDLGDGLTPEQLADFQALNSPAIQGRPSGSETVDYTLFVRQMRAARPFPAVPMVILTADRFSITPEAVASGALPPFVTQAFADALWSAQLVAQDELAAQYPEAEHITMTNAAHYIHNDNPRLVVDSIRDVVRLVRSHQ